jgi:hypothetical protein
VVSPVTYCQNSTATALTATGTNLLWYAAATGGTGNANAPIPSTAVVGTTTYYVSQTQVCGESPRAAINVVVTAAPAAPTGLNVTGINTNSATLNWTKIQGLFYTVDYKVTTSGTWTNAATAISAGSIMVSNLSPSTVYDWRVSANCSAAVINNYTSAQFTTSAHNSQITRIKDGFGIKISPDPVRGQALVDYMVPGSGTVTISLISTAGQKMQTLFSANQVAGQYTFTITNQLNALAKGSYFLRLQQNGKGYYVQFLKF